ncbi:MAG TPA: lipocalin family protein [Planctomycetota bacterium]|nr:lipocalin family protein [Planctomycetota bacterium]
MLRHVISVVFVMLPRLFLSSSSSPPLATVPFVDLDRFVGDWYVIAHIPASVERSAHNAVESYALADDGSIETRYVFRDGGFDGEVVVLEPHGRVRDTASNAEWGMRFAWWWPFRLEYLVTYLDDAYETTIIGRSARDYVWVMSRSPAMSDERYAAMVLEVARQGYDASKLRRVPQRWPDPGHAAALERSPG